MKKTTNISPALYLVLSTLYLVLSTIDASAQYTLSKLAGSGVSLGFTGDGTSANNALLYNPYATAIDKVGNVFIADYLNNRIRKVDTLGVITTIAGSGSEAGYAGDGTLATNALLNSPTGIAIDTLDNIYFTELKNNCIRKVNKEGIIFTYIANLENPTAICIDKNQNLYVVDYLNHQIKKVDALGVITTVVGNGTAGFSGDGALATDAQLHYPEGVAVDNIGNLYVSDTQNRRIRKVTPNGIITTLAGNGLGGFSGDGALATHAELKTPKGISCDTLGNIYFADADNNRIRRVDKQGNINTVLGEIGLLASVQLSLPVGVSVDAKGNIYVSDTYNSVVRKLTVPLTIPVEPTKVEGIELTNSALTIYPNPSNGIFTIALQNTINTTAQKQLIEVYNMFGQQVKIQLIQNSETKYSLDISNEASGLYFVHIYCGERKHIEKVNIVKQ